MGCCGSKSAEADTDVLEKDDNKAGHNHNHNHHSNPVIYQAPPTITPPPTAAATAPPFSEFSLADLKAATNNFSSEFIVSESGDKAPNIVYKGRLQNRRWIAIKKFNKLAWPDPKQFAVPIFYYPVLLAFISG